MNRSLALFALFTIGCGPNAGDPDESNLPTNDIEDSAARIEITVSLTPSENPNLPLQAPEADDALVEVNAATLSVRDIEIDLPDGRTCADLPPGAVVEPLLCESDKLRLEGPYTFDLVNRTASPPLDDVVIPAGTYDRVDLRLDPDSAPSEQSFTMSGTVDGAPFDLALPINEDARFENESGLRLDSWHQLAAHLDLGALMADVPLADCVSDLGEEGVASVTEDRCKDVEDTLKDALKNTFDLD